MSLSSSSLLSSIYNQLSRKVDTQQCKSHQQWTMNYICPYPECMTTGEQQLYCKECLSQHFKIHPQFQMNIEECFYEKVVSKIRNQCNKIITQSKTTLNEKISILSSRFSIKLDLSSLDLHPSATEQEVSIGQISRFLIPMINRVTNKHHKDIEEDCSKLKQDLALVYDYSQKEFRNLLAPERLGSFRDKMSLVQEMKKILSSFLMEANNIELSYKRESQSSNKVLYNSINSALKLLLKIDIYDQASPSIQIKSGKTPLRPAKGYTEDSQEKSDLKCQTIKSINQVLSLELRKGQPSHSNNDIDNKFVSLHLQQPNGEKTPTYESYPTQTQSLMKESFEIGQMIQKTQTNDRFNKQIQRQNAERIASLQKIIRKDIQTIAVQQRKIHDLENHLTKEIQKSKELFMKVLYFKKMEQNKRFDSQPNLEDVAQSQSDEKQRLKGKKQLDNDIPQKVKEKQGGKEQSQVSKISLEISIESLKNSPTNKSGQLLRISKNNAETPKEKASFMQQDNKLVRSQKKTNINQLPAKEQSSKHLSRFPNTTRSDKAEDKPFIRRTQK